MRDMPTERFENSQQRKGKVNNKVYQNKFAERTMGDTRNDTTKFDVLQISDNDYNDIEYRVVDFIRNSQTKKSKLRNRYHY